VWSRLVAFIERAQDRVGEWLFASIDDAAQLNGWSLVGGSRWSRTYRDPRYDQFDQVRPVVVEGRCSVCSGTGRDRDFPEAQWCVDCRGTGSAAMVWLRDESAQFVPPGGGQ
jgi:hypothetical protein